MKQTYLFIISLLITLSANASMLDSAKILYNNHEYSKALPIFRGLLAKSPKDASLNQWTGVCLYNIDSINDAIPLLKFAYSKSVIEASRYLAYIAYKQYRFDDAETLLNKYQNALSKAKKEIPGDIDLLSTRILNARNMLDRVEHIQIIDSINVDRDAFFHPIVVLSTPYQYFHKLLHLLKLKFTPNHYLLKTLNHSQIRLYFNPKARLK